MTIKGKDNMKNIIVVVSIVITVGTLFMSFIRNADLTFDNQKQKNDVIKLVTPETHIIQSKDAHHVVDHIDNDVVQLTYKEKVEIELLKENQLELIEITSKILDNQTKIGQDLQQIKNQ